MVDVTKLIMYEGGSMSPKEVLELFSELVKTGQAWSLQGSYGRAAQGLIESGYLDKQGNINWELFDNNIEEI